MSLNMKSTAPALADDCVGAHPHMSIANHSQGRMNGSDRITARDRSRADGSDRADLPMYGQ